MYLPLQEAGTFTGLPMTQVYLTHFKVQPRVNINGFPFFLSDHNAGTGRKGIFSLQPRMSLFLSFA